MGYSKKAKLPDGFGAGFAGANAYNIRQIRHKYLAVAYLTGAGAFNYSIYGWLNELFIYPYRNLNLAQ
jgi:hypothetical protein